MTEVSGPQLYLVSPPHFEPADFADSVAEALAGGTVACLQLWMPDADDDTLRSAARRIAPLAQDRDVVFVLNERPDLAKELGCDGVHFDDPEPKAIRAAKGLLGQDAIVGVSCRASRHAAILAGEAGADYVSFGPVFDTATKGLPADEEAMETLGWWAEMMEVPCVAVGGITPETARTVAESGCEFVCAVAAVWQHPDGPGAAVAAFNTALSDTAG